MPEIPLLTPKEIAAMRDELNFMSCGKHLATFEYERIVATLEALIALAHDRLEAILAAEAKRNAWKAKAQDWREAADEWARAYEEVIDG